MSLTRFLSFTAAGLAVSMSSTAFAALVPIKFELNADDGFGVSNNTSFGTSVDRTETVGTDTLTLTLDSQGLFDVGMQVTTGSQGGIGILSRVGGLPSPSPAIGPGNLTEASNGGVTIDEGYIFSFKDSGGNEVEVEILSIELSLYRTADSDSATFSTDGFSVVVPTNNNNGAGSYTFASPVSVEAGDTASLIATGASTSFRLHSITAQIVPEPASAALVGLGLCLVGCRYRRRV